MTRGQKRRGENESNGISLSQKEKRVLFGGEEGDHKGRRGGRERVYAGQIRTKHNVYVRKCHNKIHFFVCEIDKP